MKLSLPYLYRLQTKFAKVMFLHVSVILSTGGGGILACIAGLQTHTQGRKFRGLAGGGSPGPHPGGVGISACTEAEPPPPPSRRLLLQAVRILLECLYFTKISRKFWFVPGRGKLHICRTTQKALMSVFFLVLQFTLLAQY